MICQICKKRPASVHMTKIINGIKSELHICEQCAKENDSMGINTEIPGFDTPFSFSNIIAGLMDIAGTGALPYITQKQVKCPVCGLTYEEFKNTGRFGCGKCYETFEDKLEPLFKRIHGNMQHTGKVPKRTGGIIRAKRDIEKLKYELKKAIDNEEYEKAAELRDRVKDLESRDCGNKEV